MPNTIISTVLTADSLTYTLGALDRFIVTEDAGLYSAGGAILYAAGLGNNIVSIYGTVEVDVFEVNSGSRMTVGASGSVAVNTGLSLFGSVSLTNSGTLNSSSNLAGLILNNGNNAVVNTGVISGLRGVIMGYDQVVGSELLTNAGTIAGIAVGVTVNSDNSTIVNSGAITSGDVGVAYDLPPTTLTGSQLENSGTISSAIAIRVISIGFNSFLTLVNSGTITGLYSAFVGDIEQDLIRNTGTIHGNIVLGGSSDVLDSRGGDIFGDVNLGDGADTFNILGGQFQGLVIGGTGTDFYFTDDATLTIFETDAEVDTVNAATSFRLATNVENLNLLGAADYRGLGNGSANQINGNAGDNRLSGFAGNDTMNGDHGHDTLIGGSNNDTMLGGDGDDVMQGGAGNDTARGEDGDDVVNGGGGTDLIAGGAGLDTFVFSALSHTTNVLGSADIISDFVRGEDKVNLSAIDAISTNATPDNAFTFIGAGAFTNVAGQLRYSQLAGYTNVEMDVDGNGTIDGIVRLFGTFTLNASDFVL